MLLPLSRVKVIVNGWQNWPGRRACRRGWPGGSVWHHALVGPIPGHGTGDLVRPGTGASSGTSSGCT
jgi:hypothetical protein